MELECRLRGAANDLRRIGGTAEERRLINNVADVFLTIAEEVAEIAQDLAAARTLLDDKAQTIANLQEVLADKRRLTRKLDVALHGEAGAAEQAPLCDLIEPARRLRERARALDKLTPALLSDIAAMLTAEGGRGVYGGDQAQTLFDASDAVERARRLMSRG